MLSLKKRWGRKTGIFDLLEAGAEEAKARVELFSTELKKVSDNGSAATSLDVEPSRFIRAACRTPRSSGRHLAGY